jgi:hypothetical protein
MRGCAGRWRLVLLLLVLGAPGGRIALLLLLQLQCICVVQGCLLVRHLLVDLPWLLEAAAHVDSVSIDRIELFPHHILQYAYPVNATLIKYLLLFVIMAAAWHGECVQSQANARKS